MQLPQRRLIFGRRRGRRLRSRQKVRIGELLPRFDLTIPQAGLLEPSAAFSAQKQAVWLEIGFGGGEHLAAQAECHPEISIIGCEVFQPGIASLLAHIERRHLDNIRIFANDARLMIAALRPSSVDRVFIMFPDPWPKRRHENRRLVSRETLDALAAVMTDGAELRLATDDSNYLVWMLERLTEHPFFEWLVRGPRDWRNRPEDWPPTRYEKKARAAGRAPTFLRLRRRSRK
ncbi:MAG TPA: tRNA (guanosine(46)-N7)-methyltransferase TrmB [Stellaceae bacterium]|nr:tRNA (guanosine(46)-N7)-methyltransferase TrmB [Stellaceae bacterium]